VVRVVVLVNAVALNIYRADAFVRPVLGWGCVAVMVGWTAVSTYAYADAARRVPVLLGLDLVVAVGLMLLSPVVKGTGLEATVPGFWVMGALLAWAARYHWVGGLVAGVVLATSDLVVRDDVTQANYGNVFLLVVGGPIVGYLCASLQQMQLERDRAERAAASAAERARLARTVHDGVLQVLALVQRRGTELGGDGAELGRLAGEQEQVLRTLVREQDAVPERAAGGTSDLAAALGALGARPGVTVATPATPVEAPADLVDELVAAVRACLDNTTRHVGEGAPAWVLLEAWPDRVEVSVRDAGPGIPDGRLDDALAEGRLGVSGSIRGRVGDLGGRATLTTSAEGTEWELVVPRPHPRTPMEPR